MIWNRLKIFFDPRHRFVMGIVATLGVISLFVLGYIGFESYYALLADAEESVENVSLVLENQTNATVKQLDIVLSELVERVEEDPGFSNWTTSSLNEIAHRKAVLFPEILGIKFFNSHGEYVGSEDGRLPSSNVLDREYFRVLQQNPGYGLFISKPVVSKSSGVTMIALARSVLDKAGKFAGVAIVTIPVKYLSDTFSKIALGKDGSVTLFLMDGRYLMARYPEVNALLGKSFSEAPMHRLISTSGASEGTSIQKSQIDGVEKILSYRVMPSYGLLIVVGRSMEEVRADWLHRAYNIVLYYLLCVAGLWILLYRYLVSLDQLEMQRAQLVQSSKMSALGEMAGGIAHEINNPLSVIKGRAEQLARMLSRPEIDRDKAMEITRGIEKTTQRIAAIVKGLRTFSRSGELDPLAKTTLAEVVAASLELCQEKFKNGGVELRIAQVPSMSLYCRETQISQVILNLLGNAFDAVKGTEKPWVEIAYRELGESVEILVTDSGHGIPPEIETKIMQPFFTTKPVGQGTGLGLSISKGIIESHHGKLFLNRKCKNTQFVISLVKGDPSQIVLAETSKSKVA
jgi:signal transduction histidine kinase